MGYLTAAMGDAPRRVTARARTIPAPTRGWNARDALDNMERGFAIRLDNWIPQTGFCELRKGQMSHATGIGSGAVEALMSLTAGTTKRLIAAGNGALYDATSSGAVGAALASSLSSNRWQHATFNNRLFMFNGADTPRDYDGSTVSVTSWSGSGLTNSNLIDVAVFKERLFMLEKDTANVWYAGLKAITGTLTKFDLSMVHPNGGNLAAVGTMTLDGGTGIEDLIAFIFEAGSVAIYAGTDPGSAANWALVGIFAIGCPIGRRCTVQNGPDLNVITENGYIPLLETARHRRTNPAGATSDLIRDEVTRAAQSYGSNFGWQSVLYPKSSLLIFNVPLVEGGQAHQHVMNLTNRSWCRFTGQPAGCWVVHDKSLFFGSNDGAVYKADSGLSDNGSNIESDGQTAYDYFGSRNSNKKFTLARPLIASDGALPIAIGLGVDFADEIPTAIASTVTSAGAEWDTATWDVAEWAGGLTVDRRWRAVAPKSEGYAASVRFKASSKAQSARWFSTGVVYQPGSIL